MRSRGALLAALLAACAPALPEPPALDADRVQRGAGLFRDPRVSGDQSRACATCHPGGESDGRVYKDGEEVEPGSPGGRLAPPLRGLWQTPPYLRDASAERLEDVLDRMLRVEMRGGALGDPDRAALLAYLLSIPPFERHRVGPDGVPLDPATRTSRSGFEVFRRAGCDDCHPPPVFARARRADVGSGAGLGVPTLRGASHRPRLGHDGRWANLEEALDAHLQSRGVALEPKERAWLLEYLALL